MDKFILAVLSVLCLNLSYFDFQNVENREKIVVLSSGYSDPFTIRYTYSNDSVVLDGYFQDSIVADDFYWKRIYKANISVTKFNELWSFSLNTLKEETDSFELALGGFKEEVYLIQNSDTVKSLIIQNTKSISLNKVYDFMNLSFFSNDSTIRYSMLKTY